MLIYGDWGVGKTHTVHHICWWLEQHFNEFPAYTVIIEIGDITKTTRFDAVVRPFVETLGADFLIDLVHRYIRVEPDVAQGLMRDGVPPHIAATFQKLLLAVPRQTPPPAVSQALAYLCGERPDKSMGFGPQITGSQDFYSVLLGIGLMYMAVNQHRIVFIADEAAKLETVSADEPTLAHWVNANKLIFDDRNDVFGFIYTLSARRRTIPQALYEDQLRNRLGQGAFEMRNLEPLDVKAFLQDLVAEFIDALAVNALVASGEIDVAEFDPHTYPFTRSGFDEFIDYFGRTQEDAKPRDISNSLNDVAFIAARQGKRLIDTECLRKANM